MEDITELHLSSCKNWESSQFWENTQHAATKKQNCKGSLTGIILPWHWILSEHSSFYPHAHSRSIWGVLLKRTKNSKCLIICHEFWQYLSQFQVIVTRNLVKPEWKFPRDMILRPVYIILVFLGIPIHINKTTAIHIIRSVINPL